MPSRRCVFIAKIVCTLSLLCFCKIAPAENTVTTSLTAENTQRESFERAKIGLVLSGGGARGFAHIGALKVLEENNVPIDYVVGTSMGSIIGGLYATGLTPEEIEHGVNGIDWKKVFKDFANRDYRSFRRKQDDYDFFNINRIGITDEGLQIAPGLIEGQQIEIALDRLAYPGFHIQNFDELRIPYRAIATDIASGEAFIIKDGNLARAMRASMSVPGALPPITIDGKLLVDGGIANNIPIDVIRKMGADIIIVVDVSSPLLTKKEIKSSVDVTGQLTTILTRRFADAQLETLTEKDVLIVPGANDITSSDFDRHIELVKAGRLAAEEKISSIKKLSLSDEAYAAHVIALPDVANKNPVIHFIEVKNQTSLRDEVIRVRIRQTIGEPLDVPQLEQDIAYIYGLDYSSSVVYSLQQRDGKTGLVIYARDRIWAHSYLQFGLSIESAMEIQSINNFFVAYNKNDLNSLAGELRAIAAVGNEPLLTGEYYQPVTAELDYFLSVKSGIKTLTVPTLIDGDIQSVQRFHRNFISLSAGKLFRQTTSLSLGMAYNDGKISPVSGPPVALNQQFTEGYYFLKLFHDSLDNLSFPNSGFFSDINFIANQENLGGERDFDQLKLAISGAGTFGRYTILSRIILETMLDERPANDIRANELFWHGGFLALSGTVRNELFGQHFGVVETAFYRRLGDITFLPLYAGFSLEAGNAWIERSDINPENIRYSGSIFVGAETFLGPVYIAVGSSSKGESAFYLNISKTFLSN